MTNPCSTIGCDREAFTKGICQRCYNRQYYQAKFKHKKTVEASSEPSRASALRAEFARTNYVPEYHKEQYTPDRQEAKIRVQLYHRIHGCTKPSIARLFTVAYPTASYWLTPHAYYPTEEQTRRILALIAANGELISPPSS